MHAVVHITIESLGDGSPELIEHTIKQELKLPGYDLDHIAVEFIEGRVA